MALVNSEPPVVYLAFQQKWLDDFPMPGIFKWFLRWIYDHYGFANTGYRVEIRRDETEQVIDYCSFEDRGVFVDEADARWAANCKGGNYKSVPLGAVLPEETCSFGIHDFPQSEASTFYRHRRMPYVAVPRNEVEQKIDQIIRSASA